MELTVIGASARGLGQHVVRLRIARRVCVNLSPHRKQLARGGRRDGPVQFLGRGREVLGSHPDQLGEVPVRVGIVRPSPYRGAVRGLRPV